MGIKVVLGLLMAAALLGGGVWFVMRSAVPSEPMALEETVRINPPAQNPTHITVPDPVPAVPPSPVPPSGPTPTSTPGPASAPPPPAPSVKSFSVTGSNFKFSPAELRVKKGDTVKITFENTQGTHDLRVETFNVGTKILSAGQQETFEFVADRTGSFEYYCSVGSHRQMGMKGTLVVE